MRTDFRYSLCMKGNEAFIFYPMKIRYSSIFTIQESTGNPMLMVEGILDEYKRTRAQSDKEEIKRTRSEAESFATIIIREFLQLVGKTSGYVLKPERT